MIWIALLTACGSPEPAEATDGAANTDPTDLDPTDLDPTDVETDFVETVVATIEAVPPAEIRLTLSGAGVVCEGDEAWIGIEYVGVADSISVTPWVDGMARDPIEVPVAPPADGLFLKTDATAMVTGCDEATWVWEVSNAVSMGCEVSGPNVDAVLANLEEGCRRR